MRKKPPRIDVAQKIAARLIEARKNAGFPRAIDAINAHGWPRRTYFAHEAGTRLPNEARRRCYAKAYGVSVKWLSGKDEINQLTNLSDSLAMKSSPIREIKSIPIFTGSEIKTLSCGGKVNMASASRIPIPNGVNISGDACAWMIPADDFSMTSSEGASFPPLSIVIIDRKASWTPGCYVIADVSGHNDLILRRYSASAPNMKKDFELLALHQDYKIISVDTETSCNIIGRAVYLLSPL